MMRFILESSTLISSSKYTKTVTKQKKRKAPVVSYKLGNTDTVSSLKNGSFDISSKIE